MASVSQLGYRGIGTSDQKAWHDLVTKLWETLNEEHYLYSHQ